MDVEHVTIDGGATYLVTNINHQYCKMNKNYAKASKTKQCAKRRRNYQDLGDVLEAYEAI